MKKKAILSSMVRVNNKLYYSDYTKNLLNEIDLERKSKIETAVFLEEQSYQIALHQTALNENRIYFIPYLGNVMYCYDIKRKTLKKLVLFDCKNNKIKFMSWVFDEKYLYLFPYNTSNIYIIEKDTLEVLKKINIQERYCEKYSSPYQSLCINAAYIYNKKIYVPCCERNTIMILDIDTNEIIFQDIEIGSSLFFAAFAFHKYIYVLNTDGIISKINLDSFQHVEFEAYGKEEMKILSNSCYFQIAQNQKQAIFITPYMDCLKKYDIETDRIQTIQLESNNLIKEDKTIVYVASDNESVYLFNGENVCIKSIKGGIETEILIECEETQIMCNKKITLLNENAIFSLNDYIRCINVKE